MIATTEARIQEILTDAMNAGLHKQDFNLSTATEAILALIRAAQPHPQPEEQP